MTLHCLWVYKEEEWNSILCIIQHFQVMLCMECWMTGCGVGFMVHISVRLHSPTPVFNNSLWLVDIANYSHIIRPLNVIVIILPHLRHRELTSFKYFSIMSLVVLKWSSNFTRWYILKISSFPSKSIELRSIDKNPILVWWWYCPNSEYEKTITKHLQCKGCRAVILV